MTPEERIGDLDLDLVTRETVLEAIRAAVLEEREACAKIAADACLPVASPSEATARTIAHEIRARST